MKLQNNMSGALGSMTAITNTLPAIVFKSSSPFPEVLAYYYCPPSAYHVPSGWSPWEWKDHWGGRNGKEWCRTNNEDYRAMRHFPSSREEMLPASPHTNLATPPQMELPTDGTTYSKVHSPHNTQSIASSSYLN